MAKKVAPGNGTLKVEQVPLDQLKPHPRNYRSHPDKQLQHLIASQDQFGVYKPLVIAEDGTILAGHGVAEAARKRGETSIACVRMPLKPNEPSALKLMAADNEVSRLAEDADDQLAELLKEIGEADDLLGTGYDADELLALLTRPLDNSPDDPDDQAGSGTPWNALSASDRQRLVWGEIEAVMDGDLYQRVRDRLDSAFDAGSSYGVELSRLMTAGCDVCDLP